jgi:hypothetical protein
VIVAVHKQLAAMMGEPNWIPCEAQGTCPKELRGDLNMVLGHANNHLPAVESRFMINKVTHTKRLQM